MPDHVIPGITALVLALVPLLFRPVRGVVCGEDGRPSTSKAAAFTWTLALASGTVFLLLRVAMSTVTLESSRLQDLDPIYLLLIGSPLFALIAGKGIVVSKINSGQLQKPKPGQAQGLRRGGLLTDDSGQVDLLDLQYVLFNVVLLVYFGVMVVARSQVPVLPPTLVGLTSAAAAAYVAGKAVASNPPTVVSATRESAAKTTVVIRGQNLLCWNESTTWPSRISIAGVTIAKVDLWSADGTMIKVTTDAAPADDAMVSVTTAADLTVTARIQ